MFHTISRKTCPWLKAWRGTSSGRAARVFADGGCGKANMGSNVATKNGLNGVKKEAGTLSQFDTAVFVPPPSPQPMESMIKPAIPVEGAWAECLLPTEFGDFYLRSYEAGQLVMHIGMHNGRFDTDDGPVLVRIHSECVTSEIFGSLRCDCALQLKEAQRMMALDGRGCLIYLKQEGRGLGLHEKIRAYELQEAGLDTVEANLAMGHSVDYRTYNETAPILAEMGLDRVKLLSNNPEKIKFVRSVCKSSSVVPLKVDDAELKKSPWMAKYLQTKKDKCDHHL